MGHYAGKAESVAEVTPPPFRHTPLNQQRADLVTIRERLLAELAVAEGAALAAVARELRQTCAALAVEQETGPSALDELRARRA